MRYLAIIVILLMPCLSYAATGDTLATSLITTDPGSQGKRVVVTGTGCYGDTGTCVKMDCSNGMCSADDLWTVDFTDKQAVTIDWYERYNVWPITWLYGGNKSIRPYNGGGSNDYWGALISFHSDHGYQNGFRMSAYGTATVDLTSYVTSYNDNECSGDGTGGAKTVTCSTGLGLAWSTDGGTTAGMGTAWRHMREYVKAPTAGQSDGEVTLWVDGNLIFSVTGANLFNLNSGGATITHVNFAPVDESSTAHEHWYDNITIYEGYVPPGDAPTSTGSLRPGVSASGVTFR